MVRRPNTWTLLGRTRVTAISRSVAPISRPTPEPKASSFLKSLEMGKSRGMWLVAPRGVVPAQDVYGGRVTAGQHITDLRRHRPLHVRKLPVGQSHPRRGAKGEDGVAPQAQHLPRRTQRRRQLTEAGGGQRRRPPPSQQALDGRRRHG